MSNQAQGLVRNLDLKAPLKPILMAYANYADELGYSWAGVETIAFDTGYGVTAVKSARRTLVTEGWMASKRRFGTSAIVRLNLDLMACRQVDRGEGKRIHPDLEFSPDTPTSDTNSREAAERLAAGQDLTAARRPNVKRELGHEQPRGGRMDSREAAEWIAARRPLSISDTSEDPSVEALAVPQGTSTSVDTESAGTDGRMDRSADGPTTPAMELVLNLNYGTHTRPTRSQAVALALQVDAAVATGLDLRTIRQHAQSKVKQARHNAVTYLTVGLTAENLPAVRPDQEQADRPAAAPPGARQAPPELAEAVLAQGDVPNLIVPSRLRHSATAGR